MNKKDIVVAVALVCCGLFCNKPKTTNKLVLSVVKQFRRQRNHTIYRPHLFCCVIFRLHTQAFFLILNCRSLSYISFMLPSKLVHGYTKINPPLCFWFWALALAAYAALVLNAFSAIAPLYLLFGTVYY